MTFDYMEAFMMETFRSYGVSEEEATIATDVLLEADKRGISSHGIGRLKPHLPRPHRRRDHDVDGAHHRGARLGRGGPRGR